jgi:hypothetical protein
MSAVSRITVLATLAALVTAVAAATASADPKNQYPFTRPVGTRALVADVRSVAYPDLAPVPEAKNELPFTRIVGGGTGSSSSGGTTGTLIAGGGNSGGVDWALVGWGLAGALTIAGGTAVALSRARLSPSAR